MDDKDFMLPSVFSL